jgi:hypothetical protein
MSTKQKLHVIGLMLVLFATLSIARAQQTSPSPSPKKSDYNETQALSTKPAEAQRSLSHWYD